MNLPAPVKKSAYIKIQKKIHVAVKEVATEVMQDAAEELQGVSGVVTEDEIADTSVSCDGTYLAETWIHIIERGSCCYVN